MPFNTNKISIYFVLDWRPMTEVGKNLDIQYNLLIKHPQIFYFNNLILLSIIFDFLLFRCYR